jgi:1-phosphofructokinase family hexose kinase
VIGTITLNPSIDQNIIVPDFVKDDINRASKIIETPGGKGINVSKVIRELGGRTHAFALLGGWTGQRLAELVKKLDFPLTAIPIEGQTRVNIVISDIKDSTQSRVNTSGPILHSSDTLRLERILCRFNPKPSYWAFGGSLAPGMPASTYGDMIRCLQKRGVPCVLDTDNEGLKKGVKAGPYMIKPNEHELERLMGRKTRSTTERLRAARYLLETHGIQIVIVSLGADGALFVTREEAFHASTPVVRVRSKVGAGDSLIGGVLWSLLKRRTLREAARVGIAASTSAVMREAPRLCHKADIARLTRKVVISDLKV